MFLCYVYCNSVPHHLYSDNRSQVVHSHNHGHRYQEKRSDSKRSSIKKTNQRSVGIQMEVGTTTDGGDKIREMIDSSQQTGKYSILRFSEYNRVEGVNLSILLQP